ncbi:MAG: DNA methyltransferase, partial [Promethearchaeota archaeon]
DYFIHLNLENFLKKELEHYIFQEILSTDEILDQSLVLSNWSLNEQENFILARVMKTIAIKIIKLLGQIENFQKQVWEKKKFVYKTCFVITLDKIHELAGSEFINKHVPTFLQNKQQIAEWKELFDLEINTIADMQVKDHRENGREPSASLEVSWLKLPVDTRYFDDNFKWELLSAISKDHDLDKVLDGILIKSENWQALNLLIPKFKEKIQLIYIDPPFNKDQEADYLYKVNYKDATWLTMLHNRIKMAKHLLLDAGCIYVRCDYKGDMLVRLLMRELFGESTFKNEIVVSRSGIPQSFMYYRFNPSFDTLFLWGKSTKAKIHPQVVLKHESRIKWTPMHIHKENKNKNHVLINGEVFVAPKGRHFPSQDLVDKMLRENRIQVRAKDYFDVNGNKRFRMPFYLPKKHDIVDSNWTDIRGYSSSWGFSTENSETLLKRAIFSTTKENDLVLDFFLGSGTTVAVAEKLGRKWIGIEMGEHFWDVILPRMKKVLYYDKTGISRDSDVKKRYNVNSAGGFFKYQTLEQHEDALENVKIWSARDSVENLPDYMLTYMLSWEARNSNTFLGVSQIKDPFNFKLEIMDFTGSRKVNADLIETFSYLIGMEVNKVKHLYVHDRVYIFVIGKIKAKRAMIVWRDVRDLDLVLDKRIVEEQVVIFKPSRVYVNGESIVKNALHVEPEFKRLLFSEPC